jgi:hypothetical protein
MKKNTAIKKAIWIILAVCLLPLTGCLQTKKAAILEHQLIMADIIAETKERAEQNTVLGKAILEVADQQEGNDEQWTAQGTLNDQFALEIEKIGAIAENNRNRIVMLERGTKISKQVLKNHTRTTAWFKIPGASGRVYDLWVLKTKLKGNKKGEVVGYQIEEKDGSYIDIPLDEGNKILEQATKVATAGNSLALGLNLIQTWMDTK